MFSFNELRYLLTQKLCLHGRPAFIVARLAGAVCSVIFMRLTFILSKFHLNKFPFLQSLLYFLYAPHKRTIFLYLQSGKVHSDGYANILHYRLQVSSLPSNLIPDMQVSRKILYARAKELLRLKVPVPFILSLLLSRRLERAFSAQIRLSQGLSVANEWL